ncbi:MAG TPA: Stf0 family sulfotransferase [Dongiaceae bacterium]|nr:Stf0 family sulfotransferase [Dongiaceae bacterium]
MRRLKPFRDIRTFIAGLRRPTGVRRAAASGDRGYLICSSPRSGSTYLAELLASTGVLGVPREYFNPLDRWGRTNKERPGDVRPLFRRVLTSGATPNGVYGLKSHADHFAAVVAVIDPMRALPHLKLVRIRRQDMLAQAISWMRAQQTGQFHAAKRPKGAPRYDASAIRGLIALLAEQTAIWDRILAASGGVPLEIEYERLVEDPQREVDRVARLMGVPSPVPIDPARVKLTVQRDELSAAWHRRFLAEADEVALPGR